MLDDWIFIMRFIDTLTEEFSNITYIFFNIAEFNIFQLKSLDYLIARINAIYIGDSESHKTDLDLVKGLKAQLLLTKNIRAMLKINL